MSLLRAGMHGGQPYLRLWSSRAGQCVGLLHGCALLELLCPGLWWRACCCPLCMSIPTTPEGLGLACCVLCACIMAATLDAVKAESGQRVGVHVL